MQIGKSRTSEKLWRLRKTKNEDLGGLNRLRNGRNSIPKVLRQVIWRQRPKTTENRIIGPRKQTPCAKGMEKCLVHGFHIPCAYGIYHAPSACKNVGHNCLFLLLCWLIPTLLALTQVETLTINNSLPYSEFLVQNCGSSRGRQLWSFGRVSIFSLIC